MFHVEHFEMAGMDNRQTSARKRTRIADDYFEMGFEPTTSRFSGGRSTGLSYIPVNGTPGRVRTCDIQLRKLALYLN